jgi:hypothetical protein
MKHVTDFLSHYSHTISHIMPFHRPSCIHFLSIAGKALVLSKKKRLDWYLKVPLVNRVYSFASVASLVKLITICACKMELPPK